jgi:hypothetical protein
MMVSANYIMENAEELYNVKIVIIQKVVKISNVFGKMENVLLFRISRPAEI